MSTFDSYGVISEWVGWNLTGTSDKIWGIVPLVHQTRYTSDEIPCLVFWGRRGNKYSTNIVNSTYYSAERLVQSKIAKGYSRVLSYNNVCPTLKEDIEKLVLWAKFKV